MTEFYSAMHKAAELAFHEKHGRVIARDVLHLLKTNFADAWDAQAPKLADDGALKIIKHFMRAEFVETEMKGDSGQSLLPGFPPPRAVAVRKDSDVEYVEFFACQWPDLEAGFEERELNIDRAIAKRDDWLRKMDKLRPEMEPDHSGCVGEALRRMIPQAAE